MMNVCLSFGIFYYSTKCIFTGYKRGLDFDNKISYRLYTVYCSQV